MRFPIYDLECYPNRVCVGIKLNGKTITYDGVENIKRIPFNNKEFMFVGFNNRRYDHLIISDILSGHILSEEECYKKSKEIIQSNDILPCFNENVIDCYEICSPPSRCSLKEFGHRLEYPILENLPYPSEKILSDKEWEHVKKYNVHDLNITQMLWDILKPTYYARQSLKKYFPGVKTEFGGTPRLAEKCILSKLGGEYICRDKTLYKMDNLKLSNEFKDMYDRVFSYTYSDIKNHINTLKNIENSSRKRKGRKEIQNSSYSIKSSNVYNEELKISENFKDCENVSQIIKDFELFSCSKKYDCNGCKIKFGFGGLHGFNKSGVYYDVYDYDVSSYYPSIILLCRLGSAKFRNIYGEIKKDRIRFKSSSNFLSPGLKLVLVSIYGKMLDVYANKQIFAPNIGLTICLLGQFYLVDLIEKLNHGQCLVANTDGIICNKPIDDTILKEWTERTGFELTVKKYRLFILKDVNSYYAIDYDGKEKRKKEFNSPSYDKISNGAVISKAVIEKIVNNVEIKDTVVSEKNLYNFCYFKKSKSNGKLLLDNKPIDDPKIRFYVSLEGSELVRITDKTKSRIMKDRKIKLAMNLDKKIEECNIDYDYYIQEAESLLKSVNYEDGVKRMSSISKSISKKIKKDSKKIKKGFEKGAKETKKILEKVADEIYEVTVDNDDECNK